MSRELADGIPGARYEEMPGVGHCPQLQDPKLLLSKIAPFFSLAA
jgi:pimeloyl-ACP methyl ester carboxylesterase